MFMVTRTRKLSFDDRCTCKIPPIKNFSLLEGLCYGEFRDSYFVLGCLKMLKLLPEQPKIENETQKMQLKLFFV